MSYEAYCAAQTLAFLADQQEREREAAAYRLGKVARAALKSEARQAQPRGFIPRIAGALGLF